MTVQLHFCKSIFPRVFARVIIVEIISHTFDRTEISSTSSHLVVIQSVATVSFARQNPLDLTDILQALDVGRGRHQHATFIPRM